MKELTLDEKKKFNNKLDDIVIQSRSRLDSFLRMYSDAISYMYGDQIHKPRQQGWEYPAMNRLFADITQEVAMLSANNPKLETLPIEDSDIQDAKACGEALQGYWQGPLHMRLKIIQALYDSHLAGFYVFKWYWEPMAHWNEDLREGLGDWEGDIKLNVINPYYFGCDPDVELCSNIATDARFVVITRYADKAWAANRWKKYKEYLISKGEMNDDDPYWIPGSGDGTQLQEAGTLDTDTGTWTGREMKDISQKELQQRLANLIKGVHPEGLDAGGSTEANASKDRMVKIQEIYWRDWSIEDKDAEFAPYEPDLELDEWEHENIYKEAGVPFFYDRNFPTKDEAGNVIGHEVFDANRKGSKWPQVEKVKKHSRPMYPNGRITIRLDDECIVTDDAWPYDKWPVAVGVNYMLPHIWNGLNGIELVREMQDYLNNISCHFLNNVKHHSDPAWIVEDSVLMHKNPKSKKPLTISNAAGAIIKVVRGGINKIKRQEAKEIPQSLFALYEVFKTTIQDIDGVHDIAQGKASNKKNTLGELQMLNRNTRLRISMQGSILDSTLKDVGMGIAELMRVNLPVERWVRLIGENKESVQSSMRWTNKMASTKYDIQMVPASTLPYDEERELAKYDKATELVGPVPLLLEKYLQKLGIPDYKQVMMQHEIAGPLTQLLEMAQELGMGPEHLLQAIQIQLQLLQQTQAPAEEQPQQVA